MRVGGSEVLLRNGIGSDSDEASFAGTLGRGILSAVLTVLVAVPIFFYFIENFKNIIKNYTIMN